MHISFSEENTDTTMLFNSNFYDDLFRPFDEVMQDWLKPLNKCDEKKKNDEKKPCCSKESKPCADDEVHSWCRKKEVKQVNGDVTYRSDKEWKDGKLVKEDVFDPKKALSETTEGGKCDHNRFCGKKKDGSVRIDAERYEQLVDIEKNYEDRLNTLKAVLKRTSVENERLMNKLKKLQDALKTLCED